MLPRSLIVVGLAIGCALASPSSPTATGAEKNGKDQMQVRQAIQAGIQWLRKQQQKDGSWEVKSFPAYYRGGCTSLVLLALLEAGVSPKDKAIQSGLTFLREVKSQITYVRALQTMVFAKADPNQDAKRIQANVKWLIESRVMDGTKFQGWTYGTNGRSYPDNSNTAYAVLALHAARQAGAKIPKEVWESIRKYYLDTQKKTGGWAYSLKFGNVSYLTMDVSGFNGLLVSGLALQQDAKAVLQSKAGKKAAQRIGERFTVELPDRVYYNLHGLKKLGQLSRLPSFGKHDWYREGCEFLLEAQSKQGDWPKGRQFDQWPLINTSFALMFLAR